MPIKQVVCCICNQMVNKAQTLSVGDNQRACRSHSEVQSQAEQAQKKLEDESKARIEKMKRPLRQDVEYETRNPKCFSCRKEGLRQDEFFLEMLKCSEKFSLVHGRDHNLFDPKESKMVYEPLKNLVCLWIIAYDPQIKLNYNARCAAEIMGIVALCTDCCKKQNIKYGIADDLTFDQLMAHSFVYENTVRPMIRQQAAKEISERN